MKKLLKLLGTLSVVTILAMTLLIACGSDSPNSSAVISPTSSSSQEQVSPETEKPAPAPIPEPETPAVNPTPAPEPEKPAVDPTPAPEPGKPSVEHDYVLNKNTKKFHYPECKSVKSMSEKNKLFFSGTRDEVISKGYDPCSNCHP